MEKTLKFINKFSLAKLNALGEGVQVLGITHKGKYVLGKTYLNKSTGNIGLLNMDYAVKIAILD